MVGGGGGGREAGTGVLSHLQCDLLTLHLCHT
jgi:hypothetical protein